MTTPGASAVVTASLAVLLPDEPLPVRLMNTIWADQHGVHDAVTTTDDLGAWLTAVAPGERFAPDDADVARFRALRDALRRMAALVTDDGRPAAQSATTAADEAISEINKAAAEAPTWRLLELRDGELVAGSGGRDGAARRALSAIANEAIELLTGEDAGSLRACTAPRCVLYFVKDHPRREWCSAGCGNRARAARHYKRHRQDPAAK